MVAAAGDGTNIEVASSLVDEEGSDGSAGLEMITAVGDEETSGTLVVMIDGKSACISKQCTPRLITVERTLCYWANRPAIPRVNRFGSEGSIVTIMQGWG